MDTRELAKLLETLGCPRVKTAEMARMLEKRARQLAEPQGKSYDECLAHLLALMKQGWAAKAKGIQ